MPTFIEPTGEERVVFHPGQKGVGLGNDTIVAVQIIGEDGRVLGENVVGERFLRREDDRWVLGEVSREEAMVWQTEVGAPSHLRYMMASGDYALQVLPPGGRMGLAARIIFPDGVA